MPASSCTTALVSNGAEKSNATTAATEAVTTAHPSSSSNTTSKASETPPNRTRKPKKPSSKSLARPLPLQTYPLPAVIPHNPLTLLRVVSVLLAEYLSPPSSHPPPQSAPGVSTVPAGPADSVGVGPSSIGVGGILNTTAQGAQRRRSSQTKTDSADYKERTQQLRRHGTYTAYYDAATHSVHVTDESVAKVLWEDGFFGKGSLSRSVPEWMEREQGRRAAAAKNAKAKAKADADAAVREEEDKQEEEQAKLKGVTPAQLLLLRQTLAQKKTAADVTERRREERREEKRERARREAEAVQEQLRIEGQTAVETSDNTMVLMKRMEGVAPGLGESGAQGLGGYAAVGIKPCLTSSPGSSRRTSTTDSRRPSSTDAMNGHTNGMANGVAGARAMPQRVKLVRFDSEPDMIPQDIGTDASTAEILSFTGEKMVEASTALLQRVITPPQGTTTLESDTEAETMEPLINQEHLQLSPCEAFFLTYALGVLTVVDPVTFQPLSLSALLALFRRTSYFPALTLPSLQSSLTSQPILPTIPQLAASTLQPDDPFLLSYVTYHHFRSLGWVVRPGVKFAVDWLLYVRGPAHAHAEFAVLVLPSYTNPYWRRTHARTKEAKRDWWWLHCANRVQTQVRKSLVLAYLEVPPPKEVEDTDEEVDVGALLRAYKVREFVVGRWAMNRHRD